MYRRSGGNSFTVNPPGLCKLQQTNRSLLQPSLIGEIMKLRLFLRAAVLCSAILHVACFTSTSSVAPSIHRAHDKNLVIWFAPGVTEVCLHLTGESGKATV